MQLIYGRCRQHFGFLVGLLNFDVALSFIEGIATLHARAGKCIAWQCME